MADAPIRLKLAMELPSGTTTDRDVTVYGIRVGQTIGKGVVKGLERSLSGGALDKILNQSLDRALNKIDARVARSLVTFRRILNQAMMDGNRLVQMVNQLSRAGGGRGGVSGSATMNVLRQGLSMQVYSRMGRTSPEAQAYATRRATMQMRDFEAAMPSMASRAKLDADAASARIREARRRELLREQTMLRSRIEKEGMGRLLQLRHLGDFLNTNAGRSQLATYSQANQQRLMKFAASQAADYAMRREAGLSARARKADVMSGLKAFSAESRAEFDESERKRIATERQFRDRLLANAQFRNRMSRTADVLSDRVIGHGAGAGGNQITTWMSRPGWFSGAGGASFFRNAATQTLNDRTGQITSKELVGTSGWSRLSKSILGEGPKAIQVLRVLGKSFDLVKSGVVGLGRVASTPLAITRFVGNSAIRLAAMSYGVRRLGHLAYDAVTGPTSRIVEGTERSRLFELTMMRAAGGPARARLFNQALVGESLRGPLSVDEMREVSRQYATMPMLSSRLIGKTPRQQAAEIGEFGKFAAQMGTLDPSQGVTGALISIREALSGDVQSLRRRLEISPSIVAAGSGYRLDQLKADPELMLQALQTYAQKYVGREAIEGRDNLVSTQMQHLRDVFTDRIMPAIGESGVFDSFVARLKKIKEGLADFFAPGNKEWESRAKKISVLVDRYIDALLQAGQRFVSGFTGQEASFDNMEGIVNALINTIRRVVQIVELLPSMANSLGTSLKVIGEQIGYFIDRLTIAGTVIGEKGPAKGAVALMADDRLGQILSAGPEEMKAMRDASVEQAAIRNAEIRQLSKDRIKIGAADFSKSKLKMPQEAGSELLARLGWKYGLEGPDAYDPETVRSEMIGQAQAEIDAASRKIVDIGNVMPRNLKHDPNSRMWNQKMLDAKLRQSAAIKRHDELLRLPSGAFDFGNASIRDFAANYEQISGIKPSLDELKLIAISEIDKRIADLRSKAADEQMYDRVLARAKASSIFADFPEVPSLDPIKFPNFAGGGGASGRRYSQNVSPYSAIGDTLASRFSSFPDIDQLVGNSGMSFIGPGRRLRVALDRRLNGQQAEVGAMREALDADLAMASQGGGLLSVTLQSAHARSAAANEASRISDVLKSALESVLYMSLGDIADAGLSPELGREYAMNLTNKLNEDVISGLREINPAIADYSFGKSLPPGAMDGITSRTIKGMVSRAQEISSYGLYGDDRIASLSAQREMLSGARNMAIGHLDSLRAQFDKADPNNDKEERIRIEAERRATELQLYQLDSSIRGLTMAIIDNTFQMSQQGYDFAMRELDGQRFAARFGIAGDMMNVSPGGIRRFYSGDNDARMRSRMAAIPGQLNQLREESSVYDQQATDVRARLDAAIAGGLDDEKLNQIKDQYGDLLNRQEAASQQAIELRAIYDELRLATDRSLESMVEFSVRARQALEENLGRGISDLILGFGSLGDAAKAFARDIVQTFSDIAAKNMIYGLLGNFGTPTPGDPTGMRGGGGMFGGFLSSMLGGMFGGGGSASGSHVNQGFTVRSSARGDVYGSGLTIPRFAQGALVNKPTFAMIGDHVNGGGRGAPEAVLPLARGTGGRLGVLAQGAGGGQSPVVNVINVANYEEAARAAARAEIQSPGSRSMIIDVFSGDYQSGGQTYRTIRRKG